MSIKVKGHGSEGIHDCAQGSRPAPEGVQRLGELKVSE